MLGEECPVIICRGDSFLLANVRNSPVLGIA